MNRKIFSLLISSVLIYSVTQTAGAQTGTRIADAGGMQPETVIWFNEPHEITDIRLLLQAGKKQEAVEKARTYVAGLTNVAGAEAQIRLYFGLSALCSALTTTGELTEAIASCSDAIEIFPGRWQALNNRGVAYYVSGRHDLALQDYRQALSRVQDSDPLTELLQHNIALAEAKQ